MLDLDNFEKIFEQSNKNIYIYCFKMIRNSHVAQELMQDVFIRFFEKSSMDINDNLTSYLYRIAHNLCIDYIRKENRLKFIKLFYTDTYTSSCMEEQATSDCYSEEVERCLEALTPTQRSIMIFHAVKLLPHIEIANILNMKEDAVRKQYQRAKNKIRILLERKLTKNETNRVI